MTCECQRSRVFPVLVLVAASLVPSPALAHRLNVFASVEGTAIKVEAFFSDGTGARKAVVKVYDATDELLVEGETDAKGKYAFALPANAGDLKIVVTSGAEHRGEYTLKAEEFEGLVSSDAPVIVQRDATESGGQEETVQGVGVAELDEIRAALVRMDAALGVMQRQLAELRKPRAGVSLESIMAGVGFIVGLTGIAMYFMARSELREARTRSSRG